MGDPGRSSSASSRNIRARRQGIVGRFAKRSSHQRPVRLGGRINDGSERPGPAPMRGSSIMSACAAVSTRPPPPDRSHVGRTANRPAAARRGSGRYRQRRHPCLFRAAPGARARLRGPHLFAARLAAAAPGRTRRRHIARAGQSPARRTSCGLQGGGPARRAAGRAARGALRAHAQLILRTDVACEIEWRLFTELLELPCEQPGRESRRDALAEAILADPRVTGAAGALLAGIGRQAEEPAFRARLAEAMATYAGTRAAAAEITTSLLTLSSGALALKQLTPGAASLGPALAALIAQQSAIASFPLGAGLGGIWFGLFPAAPGFGLVAALTGGLMLAASFTAAFAGIVADPVQRRLGLHEKRLRRMLAALEAQMLDPASPGFAVHDHYVARLLDLFDMLGSAWRLAHP